MSRERKIITITKCPDVESNHDVENVPLWKMSMRGVWPKGGKICGRKYVHGMGQWPQPGWVMMGDYGTNFTMIGWYVYDSSPTTHFCHQYHRTCQLVSRTIITPISNTSGETLLLVNLGALIPPKYGRKQTTSVLPMGTLFPGTDWENCSLSIHQQESVPFNNCHPSTPVISENHTFLPP